MRSVVRVQGGNNTNKPVAISVRCDSDSTCCVALKGEIIYRIDSFISSICKCEFWLVFRYKETMMMILSDILTHSLD